MKKYLVEVQYRGNDDINRYLMSAENEADLWKQIYARVIMGYESVDDYDEVSYMNIHTLNCKKKVLEDIEIELLFILDLNTQEIIYES